MHIDHINIKAPSALLEQVRDFYCEVLGLKAGFRPAFSTVGYWLYAGEQPLVHLSIGSGSSVAESSGHLDHVAFRASGLKEVLQRLEGLGIDYRSSYIDELALTQLFLRDPAGTGLELNFRDEGPA
jgi:catechol 2,3-dioxygenase-like lactoylglutathione lyase family enzyme